MPSSFKSYGKTYVRGLQSVGKTYPNELESMKHYEENVMAFLHSWRIQRKFGPAVITQLLKDEDAIAYLMFDFMMADWHHDKDNNASRMSLRYQMGIWGVRKYLTYSTKSRDKPIESLDYDITGNDHSLYKIVPNKKSRKFNDALDESIHNERQDKILELCNLKCLNRREKRIMRRWFIHKDTLQIMGNRRHICKERVRQIIVKCVQKVQYYIKSHDKLREYWQDEQDTRILDKYMVKPKRKRGSKIKNEKVYLNI